MTPDNEMSSHAPTPGRARGASADYRPPLSDGIRPSRWLPGPPIVTPVGTPGSGVPGDRLARYLDGAVLGAAVIMTLAGAFLLGLGLGPEFDWSPGHPFPNRQHVSTYPQPPAR